METHCYGHTPPLPCHPLSRLRPCSSASELQSITYSLQYPSIDTYTTYTSMQLTQLIAIDILLCFKMLSQTVTIIIWRESKVKRVSNLIIMEEYVRSRKTPSENSACGTLQTTCHHCANGDKDFKSQHMYYEWVMSTKNTSQFPSWISINSMKSRHLCLWEVMKSFSFHRGDHCSIPC